MKKFCLTESELHELAGRYPTPFLVASVDAMEDNYELLRREMPRVGIYYAIKANPTTAFIRRLNERGACFDVASDGEIRMLAGMGIPGSRMIYANPVKDRRGLTAAKECGVRRFTFDDATEIGKIAAYVPGADVLVRIRVRNNKAVVDLNTKFGAAPEEALPLLEQAREAGLNPIGICFHVGSQSLSTASYEEALLLCRGLFDEAKERGLTLTDLDIGGGFPVPSVSGPEPDLVHMCNRIEQVTERLFPETKVWAEPGRFLCGTAVNLVTSVIGTKERNGSMWYILDDGVYGAFSGMIYDHWQGEYPLKFYGRGPRERASFVGPSCDGIDVLYRDVMAPPLSIGDPVLTLAIGAYSWVSASHFNGFLIAPTIVYEEQDCLRQTPVENNRKEAVV